MITHIASLVQFRNISNFLNAEKNIVLFFLDTQTRFSIVRSVFCYNMIYLWFSFGSISIISRATVSVILKGCENQWGTVCLCATKIIFVLMQLSFSWLSFSPLSCYFFLKKIKNIFFWFQIYYLRGSGLKINILLVSTNFHVSKKAHSKLL